jgi:alkanesulfonate monooxygenase SsuD/methylene tetrahydromethanopterin reductase-like flavin-dependent oxidoreductase (luciferase family)
MKVSLFYLPSIGTRAEIEAGRVGLRGDVYDRMLRDLSDQAKLGDALGYDSISFTEHHFHVEGFELSNNPVLLDLFVGMQTKRIRVGQLGIVLPTQNPIRVAEDIAMLDHMTGGRANAGFARGYQRRWVDVMAQQTHGIHGALPHQHDEIDEANRQAFEENFQLIKRAWTEDFTTFQGKYWRLPPGPTPWTLEASAKWGGGIENGVVTALSVVPKPVQKPHPPLFQPFASSERSIRWCAEQGVVAILPPLHPDRERALFELYAEVSGKPIGEGVGVLRDVIVADTELQERPLPEGEVLRVPKRTLTSPPQGDSGAVAETARLLVAAESPVLVAGRLARTAVHEALQRAAGRTDPVPTLADEEMLEPGSR